MNIIAYCESCRKETPHHKGQGIYVCQLCGFMSPLPPDRKGGKR